MLKKFFEGGKLVYDLPDIEKYIKWYNTKRIKENLKGMYPIDYRLHSFE